MTNNPTIDGVSRDALKKWRRDLDACQRVIWLAGGFDPAYCTDAQECIAQMDSLLDAPAVERQDDHSKSTAPRYDTIVIRGAKGNTVPKEVDGGEVVSWSQGHELAAFDALRELVEDLAAGDDSYPQEITERAQFALSLMQRRREKGWDADE